MNASRIVRPSRRLLTGALFLALMLGIAGLTFFKPQKECRAQTQASAAQGAASALPVEVWRVEAKRFELRVPATGTLVPKESIILVSEVARRLVRVHAKEGEPVTKGTVLFELDASTLVAQRRKVVVQLELAKRNSARQRELLAQMVATEADAEAAQAEAEALQAEVRRLDVEISKSTIRAPFDGVLGLRQVSEGAWVTPETPLITLQDISALKVDFQVPERHASAITVGSKFVVHVDGSAKEIPGEVIAAEPSVNVASRSLAVRGLIAGSTETIAGAFAKIDLVVVNESAILVPAIAVLPSVEGRSVFVLRDGKAKETSVEVGERTSSEVHVLSGLVEGEPLIVSNLQRLKDGAPVKVAD